MEKTNLKEKQVKVVKEVEKEWENELWEKYKAEVKEIVGGLKGSVEDLTVKLELMTEERDEFKVELEKIRTGERNIMKEIQRKKAWGQKGKLPLR